MNEYKYHYLITSFDVDILDLEDFKYNFVNLTSFRLVNSDDVSVRNTVKQLYRFTEQEQLNVNDPVKNGASIPTIIHAKSRSIEVHIGIQNVYLIL